MLKELNLITGALIFLGSLSNSSYVKTLPFVGDDYEENRVDGNLTYRIPTAEDIAETWIQSNLNQTKKDRDRNKYEIYENGKPKVLRDSFRIGEHWMVKKYCVVSNNSRNCMEVGLNPTNESNTPLKIRIRTNPKLIKKNKGFQLTEGELVLREKDIMKLGKHKYRKDLIREKRTTDAKEEKENKTLNSDEFDDYDEEESYEDNSDGYEYDDYDNSDDDLGIREIAKTYEKRNIPDEKKLIVDSEQGAGVTSNYSMNKRKNQSFSREESDRGTGDRLDLTDDNKDVEDSDDSWVNDKNVEIKKIPSYSNRDENDRKANRGSDTRHKRKYTDEDDFKENDTYRDTYLRVKRNYNQYGSDDSSMSEDDPSISSSGDIPSISIQSSGSSGDINSISIGDFSSSIDSSADGPSISAYEYDSSRSSSEDSPSGSISEDSPSGSISDDSSISESFGYNKKKIRDPLLDSNPSHSFEGDAIEGSAEDSPYLWINCRLPDHAKNAEVMCKKWSTAISCNSFCAHGYKYEEGIKRRSDCDFNVGKWTKKWEECKPFIDCTLQLTGAGTLSCKTHSLRKGTSCRISCEDSGKHHSTKKRKYTCTSEGRWSPRLPHCVESEGIDVVEPPETIREHGAKSIRYPDKYPFPPLGSDEK